MPRRSVVAAGLISAAIVVVYSPTISSLVRQWASDENYSHGFLIVPFALWFVWQQRSALERAPLAPSNTGLAVVGLSLVVLLAGLFGADLFLTRMSLIGVIAGSVLFAMMMLTAVAVVGRYVFNHPVTGAFEVTEMMLAALIYCGLPLVSQRR